MKLKIYKVWRDEYVYDDYDSIVVIAKDEEEAKRTHPEKGIYYDDEKMQFYEIHNDTSLFHYNDVWRWTKDLSELKIEYIGEAKEGSKKGIVLASFNAG